ncbi:MAG TPA: M64 family metallopeptidase [Planctomycetota bacterium]|nr:M64 family metallopeptidase [Planctomycetota bacterium]
MNHFAVMGLVAGLGAALARAEEPFEGLRVVQLGPVGHPALRVDLVIVGEGYIAEDFRPQGKWEIDSARLVKNFFEKLPFKTLRNLFNVHLVEVHSQDRGAEDRPGVNLKRTAFNATYGVSGIDRLLVCQDEKAVVKAARNGPDVDMILVLVNDNRFGGSGGEHDDIPLSVCSTQATAFEIAIHELGHSFGGLADEYVDEPIADTYPLPREGDFPEPNVTLAKLVDTSTPERLRETLKWGHYLEEAGAAKKYGKGYYEGAYYRSKGVYRPAVACAMGSQGGTGGFCFVCNAELTRTIHRTAGRGPAGGVFPAEITRLGGKLRRPYFLYSQGLFNRALVDLDRLEGTGKLTEEERKGVIILRKGVEVSFEGERKRIQEARSAGDILRARERLDLLELSFRSTPFDARAAEIKKAITSEPGFKKELGAAKEFLVLEWGGKALPPTGPQRQAWRKRLQAFLRKFDGTQAAERGKKLP